MHVYSNAVQGGGGCSLETG